MSDSDLSPLTAQDRWTLAIRDGDRIDVLYRPTADGVLLHECTAPNALMHGPRGTGKSTILRFDAHMWALKCPGLDYLLVRRTMPELRRSHIRYIEAEMKRLGGSYNRTENVAYYPNGSRGFYGHAETEADALIYLSAQFARLYFDELSTFTSSLFLKLASCVRVPEDSHWPAVVRAGTNPLGEGADFVNRWFISKDVPAEESEDYDPADYAGLAMKAESNPHLDWKQYRRRLANLPEHVRRAWLDGEWRVEGAYFSDFRPTRDEQPWHVIDQMPTVKGTPLLEQPWICVYRVLDWGFDPDPAVCLWIAVLPNGRGIVFKEKSWLRSTAAAVAGEIVRESKGMKVVDTYCDPTMFVNSHATGSSVGDIFEQNGVPLTPSMNDRAAAGMAIHEWLNTVIDEAPKLQIVRGACPMLIRTLPEMKVDTHNPKRIADGNDHWVIGLSYFCQSDIAPSREPHVSVIPAWMRAQAGSRPVLGANNVRR